MRACKKKRHHVPTDDQPFESREELVTVGTDVSPRLDDREILVAGSRNSEAQRVSHPRKFGKAHPACRQGVPATSTPRPCLIEELGLFARRERIMLVRRQADGVDGRVDCATAGCMVAREKR